MKKLLFITLSFLSLLFFSNTTEAQTTTYNKVDVYNSNGANFTDFVFSYDDNGVCRNNFMIYNNTGYRTSFNFKIYLNDRLKYRGFATLSPYGTLYFNNAFIQCESSRSIIKIVCW